MNIPTFEEHCALACIASFLTGDPLPVDVQMELNARGIA